MNIEAAIAQYAAETCAGRNNDTEISYRRKLQRLVRFFGQRKDLREITRADLKAFRLDMLNTRQHYHGANLVDGPLSPATIRTVLQTTRQFFRWAHREGYLPENPALDLQLVKLPQLEPKAVHNDDVNRILIGANTPSQYFEHRDLAFILVLRDTGARVGAVCNARLQDLNLEAGELKLIEKGGKAHTVYLSQPTRQALAAWVYERSLRAEAGLECLWLNGKGHAMTRQNGRQILHRAARITGVTGRHNPHSFRHAFARDVLKAGANLTEVSQLMGHSTIAITGIFYARWDDKELKEAHSKYSPLAQKAEASSV